MLIDATWSAEANRGTLEWALESDLELCRTDLPCVGGMVWGRSVASGKSAKSDVEICVCMSVHFFKFKIVQQVSAARCGSSSKVSPQTASSGLRKAQESPPIDKRKLELRGLYLGYWYRDCVGSKCDVTDISQLDRAAAIAALID